MVIVGFIKMDTKRHVSCDVKGCKQGAVQNLVLRKSNNDRWHRYYCETHKHNGVREIKGN